MEPIDRLQASCLPGFLAQGIVQVEEEHLGQIAALGLVQQPGQMASAQGVPYQVSRPGAEAKKIGPVGGVGGVEELALEGGQRLALFANQQGISQVEQMLALWLRQVGNQGPQKGFQGRGRAYNTSQHGAHLRKERAVQLYPFYSGGASCLICEVFRQSPVKDLKAGYHAFSV